MTKRSLRSAASTSAASTGHIRATQRFWTACGDRVGILWEALLNQPKTPESWRYRADGTPYIPQWFIWVDKKKPNESLGCYNNQNHDEQYLESANTLLDRGFSVFFKDDSEGNAAKHSLSAGACFCKHCRAKAEVAGVDLTNSKAMAEFQRDSTLAFYRRTREALSTKAGRPIALMGNLSASSSIFPAFDGAITEVSQKHACDPNWIRGQVLQARHAGKAIAFTAQHDWGVAGFRTGIATLYAVGTTLLVPWDQYLINLKHRLFMDPKDLADLYGFTRGIGPYLSGYEDAAVSGFGFKQSTVIGGAAIAHIEGTGKTTAWLRVPPQDRSAPIVVHLTRIDAVSSVEATCTLRLRRDRLFAGALPLGEVLTPVPFDATVHDAVAEAADRMRKPNQFHGPELADAYSPLVRRQAVIVEPKGEELVLRLPQPAPWAVLVLSPPASTSP